ncbi:disease resistance protein RPV1-like [Lactuca sativa]|uniref:disease resistance protein RPV1-like n=1 Tax=Lactuca sativa TaxID=4236 RepID=UPI000CD8372E|nr:disease resistance protein RPV1-like [Lactuca sativa]
MCVGSIHDGEEFMRMRLPYKKVLVLDDVDDEEQLEALAGDWLKDGSRIIITTRHEKVLVADGIDTNWIHDVDFLSDEEAISLFSRYAFKRYIPDQGYEELSLEVVRYAAGLPLTIKVLGSHLRGENEVVWRDALKRLKTIPSRKTLEGSPKEYAIKILDGCGFHATYGLRVLEQKSLITISYNRLGMHDRIEELGKNIVWRSHPHEPNKHSRLWICEEIEELISNDVGTEASTCIGLQLNTVDLPPEIIMKGLGKLNKLRYLFLHGELDDCFPSDWKFDQTIQYLPNTLQFLYWRGYPGFSLPQTFRASNLVGLELPGSRIMQLWESGERKALKKLRFLVLMYSDLRTLDFGMTPDLERLDLQGCYDLTEVHVPGCLERLVYLDLGGCSRFRSFSFIKQFESLELFRLPNLSMHVKCLEEFPRDSSNNLPMPQFQFHYFKEQPSSTGVYLDLQPCTKLESVSGSICGLQHLRELTFHGCIPEVPNDLDQLKCLEHLTLYSTHIKCLPDSLCMLKNLKSLTLKIACILKSYRRILLLEKLPEDIGQLECLEELNLKKCASLLDIPNSICKMKFLSYFYLPFCSQVQKLPEELGSLQCLEELDINCTGISHLPQSISSLEGLCIVGSEALLKSCAFATEIETSETKTFCYIQVVDNTGART